MHTKSTKSKQPIMRRASTKLFHLHEIKEAKESSKISTTKDGFDVKMVPNKLSTTQFSKITKAMRQTLDVSTNQDGALELKQAFALTELETIKSLSREQLEHAYLEGVYVAERYCALVDPGDQAIAKNANKFMGEYLSHMHHHSGNHEDIEWIKKDYRAGTGGEDVEADAALVKRARMFSRRVHHLDTSGGPSHACHQANRLLDKDDSALAAFIALRRATFV